MKSDRSPAARRVVSGLVSLALGAAVLLAACASEATGPTPLGGATGSKTCTTPVVFSEYIIDPASVKVVSQIGIVGGGNTELVGRSYVFAKDGLEGTRLPMMAPTDIEVIGAGHYIPDGAPVGYAPEWSLLHESGSGETIELIHVKDVADAIKDVAGTAISASSAYQNLPKRIPFRAGETFGWYIKGLNSIAWDFIVRRDDVTNKFANQSRYMMGNSNILHVVCPYDLFTASKRAAYYSLIGSVSGAPVAGASCGTVERDVNGTPAGQWFLNASATSFLANTKDGDYGNPLPIVLGPDRTVQIGHMGPSNDLRIDASNPTWRDPATITTEWCYQSASLPAVAGAWLWLRMVSVAQMDVAFGQTGGCPAAFPASNSRHYYR